MTAPPFLERRFQYQVLLCCESSALCRLTLCPNRNTNWVHVQSLGYVFPASCRLSETNGSPVDSNIFQCVWKLPALCKRDSILNVWESCPHCANMIPFLSAHVSCLHCANMETHCLSTFYLFAVQCQRLSLHPDNLIISFLWLNRCEELFLSILLLPRWLSV